MFADPMSPEVENLTPSLVTLMYTLSPIVARSLQAQHNLSIRNRQDHPRLW